jgi:hypothetical protein
MVRFWPDQDDGPAQTWRGLVQRADTGERRHFKDLADMTTFIADQLASPPIASSGTKVGD